MIEIRKDNYAMQWIMLLLICLFGCGSYFVFDSPAVIQPYLKLAFDIGDDKYQTLYTVYSAPAIVFCIIAGVLVDAFGKSKIAKIFMFLIFFGQIMLTASIYYDLYYLALIARATVGTGIESVAVVCSVFLNSWFKGTEMATIAFGLSLSIWRGASSIAWMTIEPLYLSGNNVIPKDQSGVVQSAFLSKSNKVMEHWINDTNGKDAFGNLIDEKQYYCYDKMKWDACQMNEKNYHLWFDEETRMKSCQINQNTVKFLESSKLVFAEEGSRCFDYKNVRIENQDMCDCLNPKFGNKASWDQYNKFKSQIEKNNWPTDVANEASYHDHWLHGVISTFKSNGESISDENVEKRNNLFKAMHKQYCIQEFKQLAKETDDFKNLGGKPIIGSNWEVDDFLTTFSNDHLYASTCGPSKKEMNAKGFDPAKFANKTIFVAPDDDDSESRRKMITIVWFVQAMVPFLSLLVAILISYLDSKAEKNMLVDNQNQETTKPDVKFSINAIIKDLLDSLKFLSLDLVVLFIMCICFYVGVFTWMTQISDFFEVYKGLPNASNVKALLYFLALPFNPIVGGIISKTERQMIWLAFSFVVAGLSHWIFYAVEGYGPTVVGIILLAFAYAIVGSSMWPIVGLLVPDKVSGMMYGAMFAVQQLGLSAASSVVGYLVKTHGHGGMEQFFFVCEAVGLAGGIFLIMRLGTSWSQFPALDEKYKDEKKTQEELQTLSPEVEKM